MKLLILGGTEFVGRAVAEAAMALNWDVTVFHRGRHPAPEGVRVLIGDREAPDGLAALAAAPDRWDLVVDTWGFAPKAVRESARLLADRAERYVYVSTRSVYSWPVTPGLGEEHPVVEGDPGADSVDYAPDKRGAELAVLESFGDRAVLARAGLILGPYENVGRLAWWLERVSRGGPTLAPGRPDQPLQYIDVRDLADWILTAGPKVAGGPYDLVGPHGHATMGQFLDACAEATGARPEWRWIGPEAIAAAGIEPWTELPIWLPEGELADGMFGADVTRALDSGLSCRSIGETVADTWAWMRSLPGPPPQRPDRPRKGVPAEREAALLAEHAAG
ncbi:SDR family oxidoreductase [Streptomyces sp. BI20]|uniref:SDR family oxidoreductase n=1 Tax=Streptomyces sp. BI20 TaxID=3403460 RepID=UPI003C70DA3B